MELDTKLTQALVQIIAELAEAGVEVVLRDGLLAFGGREVSEHLADGFLSDDGAEVLEQRAS
jgi:hypothetical protein